jgi:hypothetical protein
LASPPAIGGTAAAAGSFTTLSATGNVTLSALTSGRVTYATTAGLLTDSANLTFNGTTLTSAFAGPHNGTVGASTPNTGAFTDLSYTGTLTGGTGVVNIGSGQIYKDASGNVGIGTSSPNSYGAGYTVLQSAGSTGGLVQASGNSNAIIMELHGNTSSGAGEVGTRTNTQVVFKQNNTERMRIGSSGYVMVGTTTNGGWNGNAVFESVAPNTGSAISAYFNGSSAGQAILCRVNGTIPTLVNFFSSTTSVGQISTNGTITVYGTTSDYRLKTVIAPVSDAGTRIDALQPVEYDWNNGGGRTKGFLAHKFAEVYPNSVSGKKDAVDEEGKPVYQGMQASSSEVMADLIAEIQSLRKRVAQLESK